jgi:hypothetical protein
MSAFCLFTNSAARSVSSDQLSGFIGAPPRPAFTAVDFRHWAVIRDVTAPTGFANRQFTPDKVDRFSLALWSEKDGVARNRSGRAVALAALWNGCRRHEPSS